jgi:hypothetical protein
MSFMHFPKTCPSVGHTLKLTKPMNMTLIDVLMIVAAAWIAGVALLYLANYRIAKKP